MTAHPRRRHPCPICGRRIKLTRTRRYAEHTVDWWAGAPHCSGSRARYVPPTVPQETPQ